MRSSLLNYALAACAFVPLAVACGGQVSLGTNRTALSLVDPKLVSGSVPACNAGAAHPNVCCDVGEGKDGTCGVYPEAPFQRCDTGWIAYPDPRSCCDLDDPSKCSAPPSTPPSSGGSCTYACEPGWYPIPNGCCKSTSSSSGECYGWATDGGTPDAGIVDANVWYDADVALACGPYNLDGGITCSTAAVINNHCYQIGCGPAFNGGCSCSVDDHPTTNQPSPSNVCDQTAFEQAWTSVCNFPAVPAFPDSGAPVVDSGTGAVEPVTCTIACPSGWQVPSGEPDLCCRDVGGDIQCFSQATGPQGGGSSGGADGGPVEVDGGGLPDGWFGGDSGQVPDGGADASAVSCSENTNGDCSCQATVGGHNFELQCSDSAQVCTCIFDGNGQSHTGVMACGRGDSGFSSVLSYWANQCAFPQ
jgi:hypothetical protein